MEPNSAQTIVALILVGVLFWFIIFAFTEAQQSHEEYIKSLRKNEGSNLHTSTRGKKSVPRRQTNIATEKNSKTKKR
jgi:preprotein translocase subunit YajC